MDRIGAKKILVGGIALLGVSLIPLSFATNLWQIYFLYGLLMSFGLAAASPVLATSIVGRWFTHKRGLAMSVATSGSAFGQLLIVPVATWIMLATSWQTTYRVLAVALLAVAVPLSCDLPARRAPLRQWLPARPRLPEDGPDAAGRDSRTPPSGSWHSGSSSAAGRWPSPTRHFLAYADDMGMSVLHAANTISVTAIFSILGSVLLGLAADRYRRTSVLALTYALRGLAFLLLLLLPAGNLLYVYGLVLGISWTATTPLTAAIAADRYGPKHLGFIFGSLFTFMNLGFGFGSFLGGVIFEVTGSYQLALVVNVALGVGRGHRRVPRPLPGARASTATLAHGGARNQARFPPAPPADRRGTGLARPGQVPYALGSSHDRPRDAADSRLPLTTRKGALCRRCGISSSAGASFVPNKRTRSAPIFRSQKTCGSNALAAAS